MSLCGEHHYGNITKVKIDNMLDKLKASGAKVSGSNPWKFDVNSHGIVLQGTWDEAKSNLSVIVTAKDWYVPCSAIWDKIDPLVNHISSVKEASVC